MKKLTYPTYFSDLSWMQSRPNHLALLKAKGHLGINLVECNWIDLQPLCDLLLQVFLRAANSYRTSLFLAAHYPRSLNRVARFLIDTGFLRYLSEHLPRDLMTIFHGNTEFTLSEFLSHSDQCSMPTPLLNYQTIIPCRIIDIESHTSRESIFTYCKEFRYEILGRGRGRSHGLSPMLITQINTFFDSVLPELLDNIRIHKLRKKDCFASIYGRYRIREDRLYQPRIPVAKYTALSKLKKITRHLWQNDVFEVVISDDGDTIQESWLIRWKRRGSSGRISVPRLPSGTRVDGPDGNAILLEGVFKENASSMSEKQRQEQQLTVNLTGLHSIKQTITGTAWYFSVNSGPSHLVIYYDKDTKVARGERFKLSPGVHYQFLITTETGRPIQGWERTAPDRDSKDTSWWAIEYPENLDQIKVIETYEEVADLQQGDRAICRANYVPRKEVLSDALRRMDAKGLRLVFAELRAPIALRLYLLIESLRNYDSRLKDISVLIVTDNLQFKISGRSRVSSLSSPSSLLSSAEFSEEVLGDWRDWLQNPAVSVREVFLRCRQYDSERFFSYLKSDEYAFLREPVKWRDELVLAGGFMAFNVAIRNPLMRKMIRNRLIITLNALGVRIAIPQNTSVHLLVKDVATRLSKNEVSEHRGLIGIIIDIHVPGPSVSVKPAYQTSNEESVLVPVFAYPREKILLEGEPIDLNQPTERAMDWPYLGLERDFSGVSAVDFSSYGKSGRIRRKPDEEIQVLSKQRPNEAYSVWQTEDLFQIGHFHYQHYHYFIWIDLLKFIASRTAHSNQMLGAIYEEVMRSEPSVVFYSPNEVTEALVNRLHENEIDVPMYPVTAIKAHLYVGAIEVDRSLVSGLLAGRRRLSAVILDDALVSGETIRQIRSALARLGFEDVRTIVILDRASSEIELLEEDTSKRKHFSWWSLNVPPMGTPETCRLCRATGHLRVLRNQTEQRTIRDVVTHWLRWWSPSIFEDRLERAPLIEPISQKPRRLSTETVRLRTSDAVTTWILDMMSRFEYFNYLLDKRRPEVEGCLSELLSGLVLLYWDRLNRFEKRKTITLLLDQMWKEDRETARSLIAVALASVDAKSLTYAVRVVETKLFKEGVPNLDVATFIHTVFHLQAESYTAARESLAELSERFTSFGESDRNDSMARARSFLYLYDSDSTAHYARKANAHDNRYSPKRLTA